MITFVADKYNVYESHPLGKNFESHSETFTI